MAVLMPAQIDMARVRSCFIAWMRWYMAEYPDKAPTQVALAELLDITEGGVSHIFSPKQHRTPSLETLLKAAALTGFSVEVLCFQDAPKPRLR